MSSQIVENVLAPSRSDKSRGARLPPESAKPSIRAVTSPYRGIEGVEIPHAADTTYLAHGYFRYIGKYPAQLVSYVLNKYLPQGPLVDPMCGGGTTLVEGYLRGLDGFGIDVNPVARLASRAATAPINPLELSRVARDFTATLRRSLKKEATLNGRPVKVAGTEPALKEYGHYFSAAAREDLGVFMSLVDDHQAPFRDFLLLALFGCLRRLSRANIKKMNLEIDESRATPPSMAEEYPKALAQMVSRNSEFWKFRSAARVVISDGDAASTGLDEASAGAVFLHPPYMTNTAFSEFSQLQLALLGIRHKEIWRRELRCRGSFLHEPNGVKKYLVGWAKIIQEAARITRPGGLVTAVVGDGQIDYVRIPVGRITAEFAADAGLTQVEHLYHVFNNNTGRTQSRKMVGHHLIVFRKPVG